MLQVHDYVRVLPIHETGQIISMYTDSNGREVYTIKLDDKKATADGLFIARDNELVKRGLTLIQAQSLEYGEKLQHVSDRNTSGLITVKVNGKPKTWQRQPERVRVPAKYGLRQCFYITERELDQWDYLYW